MYLSFNTTLNDGIVYTHTHYVEQLFSVLKNKVILITHNSDKNVSEIEIPDNVIKWYAQNVNFKHEKITSIPIGLENKRWYSHLNKTQQIIDKSTTKKQIKNLLYVNHNVSTNPDERKEPYELLKDANFATLEFEANGRHFEEYVDNIYNHKFVLCPNGNGIDTHRLWETLYLSTIPIVKRSINTEFYNNLPICYIDDYKQITEEFLNSEYERISNIKYDLNKLDFDYWKREIWENKKLLS